MYQQKMFVVYLNANIDSNDEDRIDKGEEKPDLHWLDCGGGGQTGGEREVDGGQHHHAGDVDAVDQAVLVVTAGHPDIVGGLVDDVHQDGGEVGHHEDTENMSV